MDRTVLIVDEDVNVRIIAEELLLRRGHRVCFAADGAEAWKLIRHGNIAVVVLGLSPAGRNALDLLRRLRARSGTRPLTTRPRVLVVSERQEPQVLRQAWRLGADAVLRKPLVQRLFVNAVEELVANTAPQAA